MRYLILLGIIAIFLVGCAGPIELPPEQPPGEEERRCTTVTEQVPFIEEECANVSYTEQVCERKKLQYTSTSLPRVDLCISEGPCSGKPLSECPGCLNAMTRCQLVLTNNDESKSGSWTVGADFTIGNFGFVKDPITHTIGPKESATFDFHQIYNPGYPINSALCELYVLKEPVVDVCHEETRTRHECTNVTKYTTVEKEVCE